MSSSTPDVPAVPDPVERWKELRTGSATIAVLGLAGAIDVIADAGDALSAEVLRLRQENDALRRVIGTISDEEVARSRLRAKGEKP